MGKKGDRIKGRKQKAIPERISSRTVTKEQESIDYQQEYPLFSFRYLSPDYCISKCTKDEKAAIADTMRKLSQLTWQQIHQSGKHQCGTEDIGTEQCKGVRLPVFFEGENKVTVFRFFGLKPMLGIRMQNKYHVLWIDRNHEIYT